mgnify:CR=1 FL=1
MYSYSDRLKAIELYIQYGKSAAATVRALGYPARTFARRIPTPHPFGAFAKIRFLRIFEPSRPAEPPPTVIPVLFSTLLPGFTGQNFLIRCQASPGTAPAPR